MKRNRKPRGAGGRRGYDRTYDRMTINDYSNPALASPSAGFSVLALSPLPLRLAPIGFGAAFLLVLLGAEGPGDEFHNAIKYTPARAYRIQLITVNYGRGGGGRPGERPTINE